MRIRSNLQDDVRSSSHQPGGYEWWYFDAISEDGKYSFVIIFYEGNPFSTRYNARILEGEEPMPTAFPAISISVYEEQEPIYYSFTEFEPADCDFSEHKPALSIGPHTMRGKVEDERLSYRINLDERLPNGDALKAELFFESSESKNLFRAEDEGASGHLWNLVQPRAAVSGNLRVQAKHEQPVTIQFEGRGYHDHNTGKEPMRDEFTDWYWGRFHFDVGTLVYYVMNRQQAEQHRAWLIGSDNGQIIERFQEIDLVDKGLTLFGLKTARKIGIRSGQAEVQIQQRTLLDNGPFYQRYLSDAYLQIPDQEVVESAKGITEYIHPDRIYARIFWPFVDMRIRYKAEKPHWVQRSKMLYRWTW